MREGIWWKCYYPQAKKIRLVQDNLNTHDGASLYEAFPPAEARRILDKIEWHYTPKHGSWLNMAETEIRIMNGQCLDRRLESQILIAQEVAAWENKRNARRHASTGPLLWLPHAGNSANFTRQSKIDGLLVALATKVARNSLTCLANHCFILGIVHSQSNGWA